MNEMICLAYYGKKPEVQYRKTEEDIDEIRWTVNL